jgi:hypothetical protein
VSRFRRARVQFEAALRLEDGNVDALVGLAESYVLEVRSFLSRDPGEQIRAEAASAKALKMAPNTGSAMSGCRPLHIIMLFY